MTHISNLRPYNAYGIQADLNNLILIIKLLYLDRLWYLYYFEQSDYQPDFPLVLWGKTSPHYT